MAIIDSMNSKHRKTLQVIFSKPSAANVEWARMESLLLAVDCRCVEGNGSRVRFVHGTTVGTFHRPHPAKEASAYQLEDARQFLQTIGVKP